MNDWILARRRHLNRRLSEDGVIVCSMMGSATARQARLAWTWWTLTRGEPPALELATSSNPELVGFTFVL